MSLVPVTSNPRFTAAEAAFREALPALNPSTRFPTSIPTELNMRRAVDALQAGVSELRPMTAPSDAWLHQPARAAIAQAEAAIELLRTPISAVASGAVEPRTGSKETAAAVQQARELIEHAVNATIL
jgi:hypothetical protein